MSALPFAQLIKVSSLNFLLFPRQTCLQSYCPKNFVPTLYDYPPWGLMGTFYSPFLCGDFISNDIYTLIVVF